MAVAVQTFKPLPCPSPISLTPDDTHYTAAWLSPLQRVALAPIDMHFMENLTPQPGKTYAINKKGSDVVVTVDGTNVVMRCWEGLPSQKWECVEKEGWLGFVSRVSTVHDRGAYLGHNGNDSLICSAPHHREWEHFQVVLHDEGFAWEIRMDNRLAFIGMNDRSEVKLIAKGTTWWGFTVIDGGALGGADGGQPPSYAPLYAPSTRSLSVDTPQMKLVLHW